MSLASSSFRHSRRGSTPPLQNLSLTPVRVIAQRLGVSERTVNYDLNRAIHKMRVAFRVEMAR